MMGAFNINITGVGGHGCERKAKPGEKLYGRCGRFNCPDCAAYDFVQRLRQAGMLSENGMATSVDLGPRPEGNDERWSTDPKMAEALRWIQENPTSEPGTAPRFFVASNGHVIEQIPHTALFTHWPYSTSAVVDDMLRNERKLGQF